MQGVELCALHVKTQQLAVVTNELLQKAFEEAEVLGVQHRA